MRHSDDVYLVYALMDSDLHQIVRSPQALSEEHVKYFVYQVSVVGVVVLVRAGLLCACGGSVFDHTH